MDPEGHVVEAGVEVGPSLKLLSDHCKGAGTSEASGQTKEKLWVNDTSRHPKVLKIGPNHGCQ